jgi:hypothetical protein
MPISGVITQGRCRPPLTTCLTVKCGKGEGQDLRSPTTALHEVAQAGGSLSRVSCVEQGSSQTDDGICVAGLTVQLGKPTRNPLLPLSMVEGNR